MMLTDAVGDSTTRNRIKGGRSMQGRSLGARCVGTRGSEMTGGHGDLIWLGCKR